MVRNAASAADVGVKFTSDQYNSLAEYTTRNGGFRVGLSDSLKNEVQIFNKEHIINSTYQVTSKLDKAANGLVGNSTLAKMDGIRSLKTPSIDFTSSLMTLGQDASAAGDLLLISEKSLLGLTKIEGLQVLQRAGELQKINKIKVGGAFDLEHATKNIFKSANGDTFKSSLANDTKYSLVFKGFQMAGSIATSVEETSYILRTPEGKRLQAFGSSVSNVVGDTGATAGGMYVGAWVGGVIGGPFAPITIPVGATIGGFIGQSAWDESAKPFYRELWTGIAEPRK